jgi:hypothetical protein
MAHFAELNESNVVTQVLVVANAELIDGDTESEAKGIAFLASLYGHDRWKQTSYNATIRKNYAGIGFTYDSVRDAFIPPQPFTSWTLDEATCRWEPPVPYPSEGGPYRWDEDAGAWVNVIAVE